MRKQRLGRLQREISKLKSAPSFDIIDTQEPSKPSKTEIKLTKLDEEDRPPVWWLAKSNKRVIQVPISTTAVQLQAYQQRLTTPNRLELPKKVALNDFKILLNRAIAKHIVSVVKQQGPNARMFRNKIKLQR